MERDPEPVDRVRGEFLAPWGVVELKRLGLLDTLVGAGGVFSVRNIPYDENQPGEEAIPFTVGYADLVPDVAGAFCMGHPAMCRVLAAEAESAGATILRGVGDITVEPGNPLKIASSHEGKRIVVEIGCRSGRPQFAGPAPARLETSFRPSAQPNWRHAH